jgi:hypothetical protein
MTPAKRTCITLLGAVVAAAMWLAFTSPAEAISRVIQADNAIGGYMVKKDRSLAGAIDVFGKPSSSKRRGGSTCNVRWRKVGLRIRFANFGGANPCNPAAGRFTSAAMTGKGWRTANGLKIRNVWTRIAKRHPNAVFNGRALPTGPWRLVARPNPFAAEPGELSPRLLARVKRGRVVKFTVNSQAAGD